MTEQELKRCQAFHDIIGYEDNVKSCGQELQDYDNGIEAYTTPDIIERIAKVREALRQYYFADEIEAGLL